MPLTLSLGSDGVVSIVEPRPTGSITHFATPTDPAAFGRLIVSLLQSEQAAKQRQAELDRQSAERRAHALITKAIWLNEKAKQAHRNLQKQQPSKQKCLADFGL